MVLLYELIKITEKCYYMEAPTKVGFYKVSDSEVVIIDSGSDKSAGKKVLGILEEKGWTLKAVFNTHSHADHIGGNQFLQERTGCKIYAKGIESAYANYTVLEPIYVYGGYPLQELEHKFLLAKPSNALPLTEDVLPNGLKMIELPGHSFDMVGFLSDDRVMFLADSVCSEVTIDKYGIFFAYDIEQYLSTLQMIKTVDADFFLASHAPLETDIGPLADKNYSKTLEIGEKIVELLNEPQPFEVLLSKLFYEYNLTMNVVQRMLVGSTVKCYLSWLCRKGEAEAFIEDNMLLWKSKK